MELKIKKDKLSNLLRWSQGIAERRSPMQILSNLLLVASDQKLTVTATDLEIVLTAEAALEGKGSGKWVVNSRHLYEIVKESQSEEIQLQSLESHGLEIRSGKAQFKIIGMNPDDFPALPDLSGREELLMNASDLSEMIENTFYAVSTDETRYTLNGLFVVGAGSGTNAVRVVATDGHRLSYCERGTEKKWPLSKGIIIPRKGVQEIKKLLDDGEGDLYAASDEKSIRFRRDGVSLLIRLVEGDFPSYEQVIPKKLDKIISVDKEAFSGALRRASILTSPEGRGVKMALATNCLEVFGSHPDQGETREEIPIDYKGAKFEVAFNPRYLLDITGVLEDEKVVLEMKDDVSPCVIRSEFDRGLLALVMPMRI